jgi:hypothetical protein
MPYGDRLVIAAGGGIPLHWMAAKMEKLRRLSGVNCSFPSTLPKEHIQTGGPLPVESRG